MIGVFAFSEGMLTPMPHCTNTAELLSSMQRHDEILRMIKYLHVHIFKPKKYALRGFCQSEASRQVVVRQLILCDTITAPSRMGAEWRSDQIRRSHNSDRNDVDLRQLTAVASPAQSTHALSH